MVSQCLALGLSCSYVLINPKQTVPALSLFGNSREVTALNRILEVCESWSGLGSSV